MTAQPVRTARAHRRTHWFGRILLASGMLLFWSNVAPPSRAAGDAGPDAPAAIVNSTANDFRLPGTLPNSLTHPLASAEDCTGCHVPDITDAYVGSMMANAARDPLFRAALHVANQDASQSGELCIRCHAPGAWLNGRATPTDGSAINAQDLQGVTCTVCHRLAAPYAIAGEASRDAQERDYIKSSQNTLLMLGSGALVVDREDWRRGPFAPAAPHDALQSSLLRSELICANCHDIDNPLLKYDAASQEYILAPLNQPASLSDQLFPVERTYSEWRMSAFNPDSDLDGFPDNGGVQDLSGHYPGIKRKTMTALGPVTVCQDCHMPMIQAPIAYGGATRTLGKHQWAGGSAVWQKGIAEFWDGVANDTSFDKARTLDSIAHGNTMLDKAATLDVTRSDNILYVEIINNTGHKLPTGYAEGRRMWVQVRALGKNNLLLDVSGVPKDGGIQHPVKVYEIKQGLTDSFAQSIGRPDLAGEGFHFILNNTVFKDNRIPPRGWKNSWYESRGMEPVGYSYNDGQYWDITEYILPPGTLQVEATLFFQAASGEYLDFLEQAANVAVPDAVVGQPVNWGQVVGSLRDQYNLDEPVVMASASLNIPGGVPGKYIYMPLVAR